MQFIFSPQSFYEENLLLRRGRKVFAIIIYNNFLESLIEQEGIFFTQLYTSLKLMTSVGVLLNCFHTLYCTIVIRKPKSRI